MRVPSRDGTSVRNQVLLLQRTVGNAAVARAAQSGLLQRTLYKQNRDRSKAEEFRLREAAFYDEFKRRDAEILEELEAEDDQFVKGKQGLADLITTRKLLKRATGPRAGDAVPTRTTERDQRIEKSFEELVGVSEFANYDWLSEHARMFAQYELAHRGKMKMSRNRIAAAVRAVLTRGADARGHVVSYQVDDDFCSGDNSFRGEKKERLEAWLRKIGVIRPDQRYNSGRHSHSEQELVLWLHEHMGEVVDALATQVAPGDTVRAVVLDVVSDPKEVCGPCHTSLDRTLTRLIVPELAKRLQQPGRELKAVVNVSAKEPYSEKGEDAPSDEAVWRQSRVDHDARNKARERSEKHRSQMTSENDAPKSKARKARGSTSDAPAPKPRDAAGSTSGARDATPRHTSKSKRASKGRERASSSTTTTTTTTTTTRASARDERAAKRQERKSKAAQPAPKSERPAPRSHEKPLTEH